MELVHFDQGGIQFRCFAEERLKCLARNNMTPGESDMRMPRSKLWFQTGAKNRFVHAFVNLEQMRMCISDADPQNLRSPLRRKSSRSHDWQKKRMKFDRRESLLQ